MDNIKSRNLLKQMLKLEKCTCPDRAQYTYICPEWSPVLLTSQLERTGMDPNVLDLGDHQNGLSRSQIKNYLRTIHDAQDELIFEEGKCKRTMISSNWTIMRTKYVSWSCVVCNSFCNSFSLTQCCLCLISSYKCVCTNLKIRVFGDSSQRTKLQIVVQWNLSKRSPE